MNVNLYLKKKLSLPAYDQCLKASHIFNLLDARGVIGVAEELVILLGLGNSQKVAGPYG